MGLNEQENQTAIFSLMVFTLVVLTACGTDTKDAGGKETGAEGR